jgi:uncharacterized protein
VLDICFLLHSQPFIWDSEKAHSNIGKHRVRFESPCPVFFDPFVRIEDAADDDEARNAAIGFTEDWTFLFVVHLVREGDTLRINLSASSYGAGTENL